MVDFSMPSQPYIPGISPIWSWCVILLYLVKFDLLKFWSELFISVYEGNGTFTVEVKVRRNLKEQEMEVS